MNWSFTLRDASNNDVTELTEGGDAATATVSITNNVRFGADQTVTDPEWGDRRSGHRLAIGPGRRWGNHDHHPGRGGQRQPGDPAHRNFTDGSNYEPLIRPFALTATHGGTEIGSIDLPVSIDESPQPRGDDHAGADRR